MYPWLMRVARVLVRVLGVSVLVTGAVLVVWLAASALSSPVASAQTLPPPGGSSTSSSSTKHSTQTKTTTKKTPAKKTPTKKAPAKSAGPAPSSTPGSIRDAKNRQAQDDAMYGDTTTKTQADKKTRPQQTTSAKKATKKSPELSAAQLRANANARSSHNPVAAQEMADSAAKKSAAERSSPRYQKLVHDANARTSHTPQIAQQIQKAQQVDEKARKAAAAKRESQKFQENISSPASGFFPPTIPNTPSPYPRLFAREDAKARQRKQDAERAAEAAAKKKAVVAQWLAKHPYATRALEAAVTDYFNPNTPTGTGLNSSDIKDYQETYGWVYQENRVCNPGNGQFGSATDEEDCAQIYAHHNPRFALGDPLQSLESDVTRDKSNPAPVRELFKEAREGRLDLGTDLTDDYEFLSRVKESVDEYQRMAAVARAGEAGEP